MLGLPLVVEATCGLAGIARSTAYAPHLVIDPSELELLLLALIDAEYTLHAPSALTP